MSQDQSSKTIVIQQIPLKLIRPNPANRLITQDMIDTMAETLGAVGQKNPLKLRPLPDGTYQLYSGHVRRLGALKLGWETIAAFVSDITPGEAAIEGIWDNRNQPQTWLDDYRDIEALEAVYPKITIPELAAKLNVGETYIKRGQRLLRCLNQASRDLINQSFMQSRAAKAKISRSATDLTETDPQNSRTATDLNPLWELTVNPVYRLTALEDPEMVFKALQVLISRKMTEPQAKALVDWVRNGNSPETFEVSGKGIKAGRSEGKGPKASTLHPTQVVPPAPLEQIREKVRVGINPSQGEHLAVAGHLAGKGLGWIWTWAKPLLKSLGEYVGKGIADLVKYLVGLLKETFGTVARPILQWGMIIGLGLWGIWHFFHPAWLSEGYNRFLRPPISNAKTMVEPQGAPSKPQSQEGPVVQKPIAKARGFSVEADSQFALDFVQAFYGISYQAPPTWMDFFKEKVKADYYSDFMEDFFSPARIKEIEDKKLSMSFWPTEPVKLDWSDATTDVFVVKGTLTTRSDLNSKDEVLSDRIVVVKVGVDHDPGAKGLVYTVIETEQGAEP